jgi:hypothetical protein
MQLCSRPFAPAEAYRKDGSRPVNGVLQVVVVAHARGAPGCSRATGQTHCAGGRSISAQPNLEFQRHAIVIANKLFILNLKINLS